MNNKYSGYLFELAWILPSIAIPIGLLVAIVITAFVVGIGVPGIAGQIDIKNVTHSTPFDSTGVRQLADKQYEVVVLAQTFQFTPNEIHVPAGSKVTFTVTSKDVIHGFKIDNTPINVMIVPGQVSKVSTTFTTPGEYLIVCHEYCGGGHHVMSGKMIVE